MNRHVSSANNWVVHFPEDKILEILRHVRELDALSEVGGQGSRVNVSYPYHDDLLAVEVVMENFSSGTNKVAALVSRLRVERAIRALMEPYGATITSSAHNDMLADSN